MGKELKLTVGDLRKLIEGVPDETEVWSCMWKPNGEDIRHIVHTATLCDSECSDEIESLELVTFEEKLK